MGFFISVKLSQYWNARALMVVMPSGSVTFVKLFLQPAKSSSPMIVMLSRIFIFVKLSQTQKALSPMDMTPSLIIIFLQVYGWTATMRLCYPNCNFPLSPCHWLSSYRLRLVDTSIFRHKCVQKALKKFFG